MKHFYKFILLTVPMVIGMFGTPSLHASGGPDAYGYTWITSLDAGGPIYNWIDITSRAGVQSVTGLADDNSAAGFINLGFNFHYYWNDVNQMKVGSNGWVSFNNVSNIASCFPSIPTAGNGDNLLAPLMSDLNFTGAGNPGAVKYWTNSVDTFIISYINVPFWSVNAPGWTGSTNFQVILCGGDSSITYQYGALSGFLNNAACIDLTVGIENSTGGIGLQVHSDAMPPANYVIRFDYPSVVLLSIRDVLPRWNMDVTNTAQIIPANIPYTIQSDIYNSGNTNVTTTVNLTSTIRNSASTIVLNNTASLPTLAAYDDTVYSFASQWTPTPAGQYSNTTVTSCSQDINTANDQLVSELDVVDICASSMQLSYVTGNTPTNTINWNGGANDDGVAVYFKPPVYPYSVSALQFYISSNVGNGYIAQIFADDGPGGAPGTMLFNTTIASGSVVSAAWNTVPVSAVTIPGGGFYVVWLQGGTSIFLGSETTSPLSRRNYEILDGAWADFRYNETQDLCIRASINGYSGIPTAAYSSSTTVLTTSFTDNSTGIVTSWSWDFGDAQTSTSQNPTHTYAAAGTYTVCLTAGSPCGTTQSCQTITVCTSPTASFTSSSTGLSESFTDLSTGTVSSWTWDFGDAATSTSQSPTHVYAIPGMYTVCLITSNACGNADTVCQSITVCGLPVSAFTFTQNEDSIFVADASSGTISSWAWDFGDGNNSTLQNDTNRYATGGLYTVCLTVTDACGNVDSSCQQVMILITSDDLLNANGGITVLPNPASSVLNLQFANETTATISVMNIEGQEISKMNFSGRSAEVNVNDLASGIYLMKIDNGKNITMHRIVVQH